MSFSRRFPSLPEGSVPAGRADAGVQGWDPQAGLGTVLSPKRSGFMDALLLSRVLSCLLRVSLCLPLPLALPCPGRLPPLICETYLTSGNAVNHGELTKSGTVQAAAARCADGVFTAQIRLRCSCGGGGGERDARERQRGAV